MSRYNEYQKLPADTKQAVNDLVNEIFWDETGFKGKIDPRTQPQLVSKWNAIRDKVLANREKFSRWLDGAKASLRDTARAIPIFRSLVPDVPWMDVARRQIGQIEKDGADTNPIITQYILSCVNRGTEDNVEWCACFVHWCLRQAGITGLGTAWAPSWARWGRELSGPELGAIVVVKWTLPTPYNYDHIAFVDQKNGQFRMLGGNQGNAPLKGEVSSIPFPFGRIRYAYYCMPPGY